MIQFTMSEVLNSRFRQHCISSGSPRDRSVSLPFPASWSHLPSLGYGPFLASLQSLLHSLCLLLIRILIITLHAHNPWSSPYVNICNLITSANSLLLCNVTYSWILRLGWGHLWKGHYSTYNIVFKWLLLWSVLRIARPKFLYYLISQILFVSSC